MAAHLSARQINRPHAPLDTPTKHADLCAATSQLNAQAQSFSAPEHTSAMLNGPPVEAASMYATTTSAHEGVFDPERGYWVTITNIPRDVVVPEIWIRTLCHPFGPIDRILLASSQGINQRIDTALVRFASPDQALAALQLNGREVIGDETLWANLTLPSPAVSSHAVYHFTGPGPVTPHMAFHHPNRGFQSNSNTRLLAANRHAGARDDYRNLYILNLPLDATSDELTALFSRHGEVTHCVILSMMDRAARRRGFIDMGTPEQAKEAIECLNGWVWDGYPIEVSYAIVQRSNGPLSGPHTARRNVPRSRWNCGPRRQPVESSSPLSSSSDYGMHTFGHSSFDAGNHRAIEASAHFMSDQHLQRNGLVDPFTVSINGLDPVAIIDDEDLWRHLSLYGRVIACSLSRNAAGFSLGHAIATFAETSDAAYACQQLNGRPFNDRILTCQFLPRNVTGATVFNGGKTAHEALRPVGGSLVIPDDPVRDNWWHAQDTLAVFTDEQGEADQVHDASSALDAVKLDPHSAMSGGQSKNSVVSTGSNWQPFAASSSFPGIFTDGTGSEESGESAAMPTTRSEPWLSSSGGNVLGDRTNVWGAVARPIAQKGRRRCNTDDSQRGEYDFGPIGSGSLRGPEVDEGAVKGCDEVFEDDIPSAASKRHVSI